MSHRNLRENFIGFFNVDQICELFKSVRHIFVRSNSCVCIVMHTPLLVCGLCNFLFAVMFLANLLTYVSAVHQNIDECKNGYLLEKFGNHVNIYLCRFL